MATDYYKVKAKVAGGEGADKKLTANKSFTKALAMKNDLRRTARFQHLQKWLCHRVDWSRSTSQQGTTTDQHKTPDAPATIIRYNRVTGSL
jgi:hypothetical protein